MDEEYGDSRSRTTAADASLRDKAKERANKVVDKHIEAGRAHGTNQLYN